MKLTLALIEQIQNNTYESDTLDLSDQLIPKNLLPQLSNALKSNTRIRKINLSNRSINDSQLMILIDGLKQRPSLGEEGLELILSGNHITTEGIKAVVSITSLKALDVSYNKEIGLEGASILAKHPGLSKLSLNGNELGDEVLKLFKDNTSLRELDLGTNCIEGNGLENVTSIPKLTTLNLSANFISSKALEILRGNQNLSHLDLSFNSINDNYLENLGATKIESFNLFGASSITDDGLKNLLQTNRAKGSTIKKLELSQTQITEGGINTAFLNNPQLKVISLGSVNKENPFYKTPISGSPNNFLQSSEVKQSFPQTPITSGSPDNFFQSSELKQSFTPTTSVSLVRAVSPKSDDDVLNAMEAYISTLTSAEKVKEFKGRADNLMERVYEKKKIDEKDAGATPTVSSPG